jgi:glucose-6-phosphate 1-dehydrogenase
LMDEPLSTGADDLHEAKTQAIRQLEFDGEIVTGQYANYADELQKAGLNKDRSNTETYAELSLKSSAERWKGTRIILRTGKHLDRRHAMIEIYYFKEPCRIYCDENTYPNKLVLNVQPIEDIEFMMNTKVPRSDLEIRPVKLKFSKESEFNSEKAEGYEVIIEECIRGDQTLFISNSEIEASWRIIDKVREHIKDRKPHMYQKGIGRIEVH